MLTNTPHNNSYKPHPSATGFKIIHVNARFLWPREPEVPPSTWGPPISIWTCRPIYNDLQLYSIYELLEVSDNSNPERKTKTFENKRLNKAAVLFRCIKPMMGSYQYMKQFTTKATRRPNIQKIILFQNKIVVKWRSILCMRMMPHNSLHTLCIHKHIYWYNII